MKKAPHPVPGSPSAAPDSGTFSAGPKRIGFFERYLTFWVLLCMAVGMSFGRFFPGAVAAIRGWEFPPLFGPGSSEINPAIAVLIRLMIYPMMLKIDFGSLRRVGRHPQGLGITLFVNWVVKPFSMAFLGWLFFKVVFARFLDPAVADPYLAGSIILAAAPCTAMVFVWSYLTDGDPAYTLVQVAVNDLLMLLLFAPLVGFLIAGASALSVPFSVLFASVFFFIVIPLVLGALSRVLLVRWKGLLWFEAHYLPKFQPLTMAALLFTLVLLFAFQADNIRRNAFHVVLIAVPILIQVYFNSGLAYLLMRRFRLPHNLAAPGMARRRPSPLPENRFLEGAS